MNRKDFIVKACTTCLSITAISTLLPACGATHYITGSLQNDGLSVNKEEFLIKDKGNIAYRSFIIIQNDALQYPICVYRLSELEYSALWMSCTHQGTTLQASGDILQCPAHGSEFNNKGMVTNGPAANVLRSFPVAINNTDLFIDLRKKS